MIPEAESICPEFNEYQRRVLTPGVGTFFHIKGDLQMKKWLSRLWLAVSLPCLLNLPLCIWLLRLKKQSVPGFLLLLLLGNLIFLRGREKESVGVRVRMMRKGAGLSYFGLYGMSAEILLIVHICFRRTFPAAPGTALLVGNAVFAFTGCALFLMLGVCLMIFTSRRLGVVRRMVMILTMWIPPVNLAVLLYACRLVCEEYNFELEKAALQRLRVDSDLCRTRYPLVMVHGIGFRDLRYFNYWGRIPRELKRNGAAVYYGNQEAFGTIVYNAEDIKKRILQVVEETGCGKVNIIAHSKGGLDARYAVSRLGMGPYVASLTTMNTPHRGCRFVDYACRLPDGLYRLVASCFDRTFSRFGDRNPDFYTATHQFSTRESEEFNRQVPDVPGVYYQSYTSRMKNPFSHLLLAVPYCMIRPLEGENDGLVSVTSAKWGEFQGVFSNSHTRGISHGDIIDLKREDYKGFDVVETYIQIVSKLKEKGF